MAYKPPYFLLYVNDLLASSYVDLMDAEQFGWYMKLLMRSWQSDTPCYLPNQMEVLRGILRIGRRAKEVAVFQERFGLVYERFAVTPDGTAIFHPKLVAQYQELIDKHDRQAGGGKATQAKQAAKLDGKQALSQNSDSRIHKSQNQNLGAVAPKPQRGTRIPKDFQVTGDHRAFAAEHGYVNPDAEVQTFKDYWTAKPGTGALKLDWDATFRVWLSKAEKYRNGGPRTDKSQQRDNAADEAIADVLGMDHRGPKASGEGASERSNGSGNLQNVRAASVGSSSATIEGVIRKVR